MLDATITHCTAEVVFVEWGWWLHWRLTVTTRPIIRTRAGAEPPTWKTPLEGWRETELHQMLKLKTIKSHWDPGQNLNISLRTLLNATPGF